MGWFDKFEHFDYQCECIRWILRLLDAFGQIWKFRITAEELSQIFCRIHQQFKVRMFANQWVALINLGILIIHVNLFVEFYGSWMHFATFENFVFLQESSVRSFAGFNKNSKSEYLPINGLIWWIWAFWLSMWTYSSSFTAFGWIRQDLKISRSGRRAQSALWQDSPKIQSPSICQ